MSDAQIPLSQPLSQSLIAIATGIEPVVKGEPLSGVSAPEFGSTAYADTLLEFEFAA